MTWVKGGLWFAFLLSVIWTSLGIFGHQIWYSGESFSSVVYKHVGITVLSLISVVLGMMINIRLGLATLFAAQAVLSSTTSKLALMKDKWEAPDFHPDFADTHTAYLAQVFQIISYICWGLLFVTVISVFWKQKGRKMG